MSSPETASNHRNDANDIASAHVTRLANRALATKCIQINRHVLLHGPMFIMTCFNCKETFHPNQESITETYHIVYEGCLRNTTCYYCRESHYEVRRMLDCSECTDAYYKYVAYLHVHGKCLLDAGNEAIIALGNTPPELIRQLPPDSQIICLDEQDYNAIIRP